MSVSKLGDYSPQHHSDWGRKYRKDWKQMTVPIDPASDALEEILLEIRHAQMILFQGTRQDRPSAVHL